MLFFLSLFSYSSLIQSASSSCLHLTSAQVFAAIAVWFLQHEICIWQWLLPNSLLSSFFLPSFPWQGMSSLQGIIFIQFFNLLWNFKTDSFSLEWHHPQCQSLSWTWISVFLSRLCLDELVTSSGLVGLSVLVVSAALSTSEFKVNFFRNYCTFEKGKNSPERNCEWQNISQ